jgi:hypothetical protein
MITINNSKVAGFAPRWAYYRGFSLFFDSPGQSLTRVGERLDLNCDVDADPELTFYKALRDTLNLLDVDRLVNTYLFCPLPSYSYHVTLWAGATDGNLARVKAERRAEVEAFLASLPEGLGNGGEVTGIPERSPLVTRRDWNLRFRLGRLENWGDSALVARLTPADAASNGVFERLSEERQRLNTVYREAFGISRSDAFTPHVSLGYFANEVDGHKTVSHLPEWDRLFQKQMAGLTLDFSQASVYGFTDMATFFKSV